MANHEQGGSTFFHAGEGRTGIATGSYENTGRVGTMPAADREPTRLAGRPPTEDQLQSWDQLLQLPTSQILARSLGWEHQRVATLMAGRNTRPMRPLRQTEVEAWRAMSLPRDGSPLSEDDKCVAWTGDAKLALDSRKVVLYLRGERDQVAMEGLSCNECLAPFMRETHTGLLTAWAPNGATPHVVGDIFEACYLQSPAFRSDFWDWALGPVPAGEPRTNVRPVSRSLDVNQDQQGWCWRVLFTHRAQPASFVMPRWPTKRQLLVYAATNPLVDGKFTVTEEMPGYYHVRSDARGSLTAQGVLDTLPGRATRLGGSCSARQRKRQQGQGKLSGQTPHYANPTLAASAPAKALQLTLTCLMALYAAFGEWTGLTVFGLFCSFSMLGGLENLLPAGSRDREDGYCYLQLFHPDRRVALMRLLGRYPRARAVLSARPDFSVAQLTGSVRLGHVEAGPPIATRGRQAALWSLTEAARYGMRIGNFLGVEGEEGPADWQPAPPEPPHVPFYAHYLRRPDNYMYRGNETAGGLRNPRFPTLHQLAPEVIASTVTPHARSTSRHGDMWDLAMRYWKVFSRPLPTDAFVVVTAYDDATSPGVMTHLPVWDVVPGATHGVIFCRRLGNSSPHPSWTAIAVPLRRGEGRLLAGLRTIPAFYGRTDVDIAIVNARNWRDHPVEYLHFFRDARVPAAAACNQYLPTNNGAQFVRGGVYEADRKIARESFSAYGHVYGWDEAVFYTRSPAMFVPNPQDYACAAYSSGVVFKNVTWMVQQWGGPSFEGFTYAHFGAHELQNYLETGKYVGHDPRPYLTVESPHKPLSLAVGERRVTLREAGIPAVQWGADAVRLPRVGGRQAQFKIMLANGDYEDAYGATWRARDREAGLRNSLDNSRTQCLSAELFSAVANMEGGDPHQLSPFYENVAREIGLWATRHVRVTDGVIGIASVPSRDVAQQFKLTHERLFKRWVFFTEGPGGRDGEDLYVTLPTVNGTGSCFQLARLLPGVFSPPDVIYSVTNDLETNWIPRATRLEMGVAALTGARAVFPAMDINHPNPFQDAVFRGDAFHHRRESLFTTIANWGWVYGVDEAWVNLQEEYPTVACRARIGGACSRVFKNPVDACLWVPAGDKFEVYLAPGGNFRQAVAPEARCLRKTIGLTWSALARRTWNTSIYGRPGVINTYSANEWDEFGKARQFRAGLTGERHLAIFLYGTRGDRIPLHYIGAILSRFGVHISFVELCTVEQANFELARCERDEGYLQLPTIAKATWRVACYGGPSICPDYLRWSSGLSFSLCPARTDAGSPGGGFPRWIDFLIRLSPWTGTGQVKIGLYRGPSWFPRSANGSTQLTLTPPRVGERVGRVGGSSSVPPPPEYAAWPLIPAGNHEELFKEYDVIASAGGAGVVQTIAAAGARAVVWDDHLDRKYHDPTNAGKHVTGNEPATKIALIGAWYWPGMYWIHCKVNPVRWAQAVWWRCNVTRLPARLWYLAFVAWSLRYTSIMPTFAGTVAHAFGLRRGWFAALASWGIAWGLASYASLKRRPILWLILKISWRLAGDALHPVSTFLVFAGWHPLTATAVLSLCREIMPSPSQFSSGWRVLQPLTSGKEAGVWWAASPVWVCGLPLGLHSTIFCPETSTRYDGTHTSGDRSIGSGFRLVKRRATRMTPLFAFMLPISEQELPLESGPASGYSALWNCQTMAAGVWLRHSPVLLTLEGLIILFATSYAVLSLAALTLFGFFAGSGATVALLAIAPLAHWFPQWELEAKLKTIKAITSQLTIGFADEEEETLTIDLLSSLEPSEGAVRCLRHGTIAIVGESGPHEGVTPAMACGCRVAAPGDHRIDLLQVQVLRRGEEWRLPAEATGAEATECVLRDSIAALSADLIRAGYTPDAVFEAAVDTTILAARALEQENQAPSDVILGALYETHRGPSETDRLGATARLMEILSLTVRSAAHLGIPRRVLESIVAIIHNLTETAFATSEAAVAVVCVLLDYLAEKGVAVPARELATRLLAALDRTTPHVARKKNIWAILDRRQTNRLRRSDWLALGIAYAKRQEENPDSTLARILENLNRFAGPKEPLSATEFRRPVRLPGKPRVSEQETHWPSLLQTLDYQIDAELTERVSRYLDMGGHEGLDGVWTATEENEIFSLSRYFATPTPLTNSDVERAEEVAAALYAAHPEAFKSPGVVSPETVRKHLVKKYSPGLPFIGRYKTRQDLIKSGWMTSIMEATLWALETGLYPPQAYHAFPKMMVLDAAKVTQPGKVRTVVAQDLASTFVDQVVQLERTKRPVWPTAHIGAGAPLTAAYLARAFERVAERGVTFSADVTAFDASCPPILFEILSHLAKLGAEDGGIPQVGSVLRAKYLAMQNAIIIDLPTGRHLPKRKGGATGESATSWDDTWMMRGLMMLLWSDATGLPASDFYRHNSVHNTGDDNIWGTDSDLSPDTLVDIAKTKYGLTLRIEARGNILDLTYLSKKVIPSAPFADEIAAAGGSVGDITVIHDRERLLTRRAGVTYRAAGQGEREFRQYLLGRTVGHSLLTWHQPDLYSMLAHEWVEDAARFVGVRADKMIFNFHAAPDGYARAATAGWAAHANPTADQRARMNQLHAGGEFHLPSYARVVQLAYAEKEVPPPLSPYAYVTRTPPAEAILRERTITFRETVNGLLSDALIKLMPTAASAPFSPLFYVWGYPVEKFLWMKATRDRTGRDPPTSSEFAALCRAAPYGVATDPTGFWWLLAAPGSQEAFAAENPRVTAGRMYVATAAYLATVAFARVIRAVPLLGLLWEALEIYTRDVPRIYAVLGTLFWLEQGEPSSTISALLPRDPFATQKQLSVMVACIVPDWVAASFSVFDTLGLISKLAEIITTVKNWRIGRDLDLAYKSPQSNAWEAWIERIQTARDVAGGHLTLRAPTSTGKSTAFPAALARATSRRVWVVVPRIALREEYTNIWWAPADTIKLKAGVTLGSQQLIVCTYGHLLARTTRGAGPEPSDEILLDEFHENAVEMGLAWHRFRNRPLYILSATPHSAYAETEVMTVPLERPFEEAIPTRLPLAPMGLYLEATRTAPVKRALFVVPTLRQVDEVTEALRTLGEEATALSSRDRTVARTGHIVATAVVDAGITIAPAPDVLIDSGLRVTNHRGRLMTCATDPATDIQRRGRVGRLAAARVYTSEVAGTGTVPLPYPTHSRVAALGYEERKWVLDTLGIHSDLVPMRAEEGEFLPLRTDPYVGVSLPPDAGRDTVVALAAWWWLACENRSAARTALAYDAIVMRGWSEAQEGLSELLLRAYGSHYLGPRSLIAGHIAQDCFFLSTGDGRPFTADYVTYVDGRVTWARL